MQRTNSVTNRSDAKRMLTKWADALRERLDQARATGTPNLAASGG